MIVEALLAFVGGVSSFFTPCVALLLPYVVAYSAGLDRGARQGLMTGLGFTLGLSSTYAFIGYASSSLLRSLGLSLASLNVAVGVVVALLGAMLIASSMKVSCKLPRGFNKLPRHRGLAGALLMGSFMGLTYIPCATPIMASVLIMTLQSGSKLYTTLILFIYGLGLGTPLILLTSVTSRLKEAFEAKMAAKLNYFERLCGGVLIALGALKALGVL